MGPHDRFLELCAISTSGELTGEEQKNLQAHLAECADCRQAFKEFAATAAIGMPLLHSDLASANSFASSTNSTEGGKTAHTRARAPIETALNTRTTIARSGGLSFPYRNGDRNIRVNWNYVWMPFAAAVVLTAALGICSFQVGKYRGRGELRTTPIPPGTRVEALERSISDAGQEREVLKAQLADRDQMIAELRTRVANQSAALNETKSARVNLEQALQGKETEKQQVAQERITLSQQLDAAQTSLQKTRAELDSLRQLRAQDQSRSDSLEAQITDLHGQLRNREQALGEQQDLLSHDRDIRDLMGARDLYIAEVYDVARNGQTQKPYGRVFYTRGKSLIFYAYDLDQQSRASSSSTFQAWGRRGADKQEALNLGIFFEDNAAKTRWVLKFNDPQALAQIDGVFVTVEPKGGSHKPSGKALLFASLKIEPNHP